MSFLFAGCRPTQPRCGAARAGRRCFFSAAAAAAAAAAADDAVVYSQFAD